MKKIVNIACVKENEEDRFILTLGEYRLTDDVFESREEAEMYVNNLFSEPQQELMTAIIMALINIIKKFDK